MPKPPDFERLKGEIEELFDELWQVPRFSGRRQGFRPQVDCFLSEDPAELTIVAELAGVDPEEVALVIHGQELVIEGVRRRQPCEGRVYQQMEIEHGPFRRRLLLGVDVDPDGVRASYQRGMLTIVLPIAPRPAGPVKVPIEVAR